MAEHKANILVVFYSRDGSVEALLKPSAKEPAKLEPTLGSAAYPISFLPR